MNAFWSWKELQHSKQDQSQRANQLREEFPKMTTNRWIPLSMIYVVVLFFSVGVYSAVNRLVSSFSSSIGRTSRAGWQSLYPMWLLADVWWRMHSSSVLVFWLSSFRSQADAWSWSSSSRITQRWTDLLVYVCMLGNMYNDAMLNMRIEPVLKNRVRILDF